MTSEPSNRAALFTSPTVIEEIQHYLHSGTTSLGLLDEPYKLVYSGVVFKKSSPLVRVFNEMVSKMESNGMMELWRRLQSFSTTKTEDIGPQVLTMDHLKNGFLACCIPMVLAVIAFIGEFAWMIVNTICRTNSNDLKRPNNKANYNTNNLSPEFRRAQPQERNVEAEEMTEMNGIEVEEIPHEARVNFDDMADACNGDDFVRACQEICDGIDDLVDK